MGVQLPPTYPEDGLSSSAFRELRSPKGQVTCRRLLTMLQSLQLQSVDLNMLRPMTFQEWQEEMVRQILSSCQTPNLLSTSLMEPGNARSLIFCPVILSSEDSIRSSTQEQDG